MTKHTPGPWRTSRSGREVLTQDGNTFIADCENRHNPEKNEPYYNAALVAAAPDLLAALIALSTHSVQDAADQIKTERMVAAAIAKATGGTT